MRKIMILTIVLSFLSLNSGFCASGPGTQNPAQCQVSIANPQDQAQVPDNRAPNAQNVFTFNVSGNVTNPGNNVVCMYQSTDGVVWWFSGNPITRDALGANGAWSSTFASCGPRATPHPACKVKMIVQPRCYMQGTFNLNQIGTRLCDSPTYTYSPIRPNQ